MGTIYGTTGNDTLNGTSGDDVIYSLGGKDVVDGMGGIDKLIVSYTGINTAPIAYSTISSKADGTFFGKLSGADSLNSVDFSNIEVIQFAGSDTVDSLDVDAAALASVGRALSLDGGGGVDTLGLDVSTLAGTVFKVSGTSVTGNRGTFTNWENYTLRLGSGSNQATTGAGDDIIYTKAGSTNTIDVGAGTNRINSSGIDTVKGGAGIDYWTGYYAGSTADVAFAYNGGRGSVSNGTTFSKIESATINTGSGNDNFYTTDGYLTIDAGAGIDQLSAIYAGNNASISGAIANGGNGSFAGGIGAALSFTNLEQIEYVGYDGSDFLTVDAAPLASAGTSLSLDGGDGYNALRIDFSSLAGTIFRDTVTRADGGSNRGTFNNWSSYDINLGGGNNVVATGAGRDQIFSHGGVDRIDGGANDPGLGDDWFEDFGTSTAPQTLLVNGTHATVSNGTVVDNIESYGITMGDGDDIVSFKDSVGYVDGGAGRNSLAIDYSGTAFPDRVLVTVTSAGSVLTGSVNNNTMLGGTSFSDALDFDNFSSFTYLGSAAKDSVQILGYSSSQAIQYYADGGAGINELVAYLGSPTNAYYFVEGPGQDYQSNNIGFAHFAKVTMSLGQFGDTFITADTTLDVQGLAGGDVLRGGSGDDKLDGGADDDIIGGGAGNDTLIGGDGIDMLSYDDAAAGVNVNLSFVSAQDTGGAGSDTISGFENLTGSAFDDLLVGNSADNILVGGAGRDQLNGAGGVDTADYSTASAGVKVRLDFTGWQDTGGAGVDRLLRIENLTGSAFNDTLSGDRGINTLDGGMGIDTLSYATATSGVTVGLAITAMQYTGGGGFDTILNFENLIGTAYDDTLTGDGGANTIEGGAGNDVLDGGMGVDTLSYASAGAGISINLNVTGQQGTGGAGSDTVSNFENVLGSNYDDYITGTDSDNYIVGGGGADKLYGAGGSDRIDGGAGTDILDGGDGNDILDGGAGNDTLTGGADIDTASYASAASGVTVSLAITVAQNTVGAGTDRLVQIENLTGSAYNDTLVGSAVSNALSGGDGNDVLTGGGRGDVLTGGNGADRFVYLSTDDSISTPASRDEITDFRSADGDRIDLSAIDAVPGGADNAFTFIDTHAFNHVSGELRVAGSAGAWVVYGDTNGDAIADLVIAVDSALKPVVGDFIL